MYSEIEKQAREQFKVLQAAHERYETERRIKEALGGLDMEIMLSLLKGLNREGLEKLHRPLARQIEDRVLEQVHENRRLFKWMHDQPTVPVVYDYVSARNKASARKTAEFIRAEVKAEVTRQLQEPDTDPDKAF